MGEVEASCGGQILHGENKYTAEQRQEHEQQEQAQRQERLNELLAAFREQLFPYRDQIQPMFAEFDAQGDGHCEVERFRQMLEAMGVEVDESDMGLLLESFHDPDVQ